MRLTLVLLATIGLSQGGSLAQAGEPNQSAAASASAAQTPAAETQKAAPTEGTAAAVPAKSAAAAAGADPEKVKQLLAQGYKPEKRKGTLVYCKSDVTVGTHFEHTTCIAAPQ